MLYVCYLFFKYNLIIKTCYIILLFYTLRAFCYIWSWFYFRSYVKEKQWHAVVWTHDQVCILYNCSTAMFKVVLILLFAARNCLHCRRSVIYWNKSVTALLDIGHLHRNHINKSPFRSQCFPGSPLNSIVYSLMSFSFDFSMYVCLLYNLDNLLNFWRSLLFFNISV